MAGRHRRVPPPRHGQRGRHRKSPTRQLSVLPTVTAVAVLAVAGVGLGHAVARGQAHGASVTPGATAVTPPVIATTLPSPVVVPSSPARPPAKPHHRATKHKTSHPHHHRVKPPALTVTDTGPACYVQVTTREGHLLVRKILHGHQHLTFRRHGLDVVLGNAGAVRIALDGHHARPGGRAGQVRSFQVH